MANLSTVTLPDTNTYGIRAGYIPFGKVDNTSTATAFTATVPGITALVDGACCYLMNGVVTSASGWTLDVNGLGALPVYQTLAASGVTTTIFNQNYTMLFVYNSQRVAGGCWDIFYGYNSNTTYSNASLGQGYATCSTAEATVAKTASLSSYALTTGGIVAVKFTYAVPANATLNINSKGAKAIYYRGAKITGDIIKAGDIAYFIYSTYYHLLGIDRKSLEPIAGTLVPKDVTTGSGVVGTSTAYARDDHQHAISSGTITTALGYTPSAVSINRLVSTGTNIADITIDGTTTQLYAPSGGGSQASIYPITLSFSGTTVTADHTYAEFYTAFADPDVQVRFISGSANIKTVWDLVWYSSTDGSNTTGGVWLVSYDIDDQLIAMCISIGSLNVNDNMSGTYAEYQLDNIPTPGNTASAVGTSSSGGSATTYSRSDHVHSIDGTTIGNALGYTPYNGATNPNGYITDAGVTSFNGSTGAVTYTAPVTSVNGSTGAVTVAVPSAGTTATAVSTSTSGGSASTYSKSDHVHSINSTTINSALGYTPADKSKVGVVNDTNDVPMDIVGIEQDTISGISGVTVHCDDGSLDGKDIFLPDGVGFNTGSQAIINQIPTNTSDLNNDSGFLTSSNAVTSFNGSTGAVTYTAPVTSVNGATGAVTLTIPDALSITGNTISLMSGATTLSTITLPVYNGGVNP